MAITLLLTASEALHQRLKTTIIYVTHDQIEATMADKIVVMHDGRVEQVGAPLDLYDRPGNLFVAGFIGSPAMNFFPGTIRCNGKAEFAGPGGISLPLGELPQAAWRGRRQTRRLRRSPRAFHACRGRCGRRNPGGASTSGGTAPPLADGGQIPPPVLIRF
jgi:ABC-type sugar transport system ATPase subunit